MHDPLESVVKDLGGDAEVSRILGHNSASLVYNWRFRGVPAEQALRLEEITGRKGLAMRLWKRQPFD